MNLDASLRLADHHGAECRLEACDAEALARLLANLLDALACPVVYHHLADHLLASRLGDLFGGLAEYGSRLRRLLQSAG